jgi:hypothetical protein
MRNVRPQGRPEAVIPAKAGIYEQAKGMAACDFSALWLARGFQIKFGMTGRRQPSKERDYSGVL